MRRLLLVRHGRSAHVHDGSWIDSAGARRFEAAYDLASIRDDDLPPAALLTVAEGDAKFLASDLPRAVESVRRLARGKEFETTPLLREMHFDLPNWGPRLPVVVWDVLHYAWWTPRILTRADSEAMRRAAAAADWIEGRCSPDLTIAVTHGSFRRLLSAQLIHRGWQREDRRNEYHNWSAWTLTKEWR
jgi:broad specificity phosphatase PhoE